MTATTITTTIRGGKHRALLTPKGKPWTEAAVIGRDRFVARMVALGVRPHYTGKRRRDDR